MNVRFERFRRPVYAVLRALGAAGMLALILIGFLSHKTVVSDTPIETVLSAVEEAAQFGDALQEGDPQMLRRLYGFEPDAFEDYRLLAPSSNMGAEELLLVKLRDPADAEALRAAAEKRVQAQISVFEGYAPRQTALLKNHAVIETPGNYFLYVVCENADRAAAAFHEVL